MIEDAVEFDLDTEVEFDMDVQNIPNAMDAFYEKPFWFSYSSKKLLLYNPPAFMEKYINKNYEERLDKHLVNGKLIHCLILQPDEFPDMFIVSPLKVPEGNSRTIVHNAFKEHRAVQGTDDAVFADYSTFIISELVRINLHQSLVNDTKAPFLTGDSKRLAKVLTDENSSYFAYMLTRGAKNVIDQKQLDYCTAAANIIRNNPQFVKLMGIGSLTNEVVNEKMFYLQLADYSFGLKGVIDNLNIDHAAKIIYVNDFKTTNKELSEFAEAVEFWSYSSQAIIYMELVAANYKSLIYEQGYTVQFHFIAIDKNMQAYAFKVTEKTLNSWLETFKQKLVQAAYHFNNRSYDLPYAFANNLVTL